jgi:signal transduction histidine kinase
LENTGDNIFILIIIGSLGALIISLAVFYFVVAYIKKTIRHKEEMQKREIEYQAQLFTTVVNSQEEERRLIGKELHDEVSSVLYALKFRLKADSNPENTANLEAIDKIIVITRNISHLLSPPEVEMLGFHDSMKELCNNFSKSNGDLRIHLVDNADGFIPKKQFQVSLMLYRVLQELITNTIKHAQATEVNITILNTNDEFQIIYQDNGIGIKEELISPHSLGLKNITSRLLLIKANYQFIKTSGFKFEISLNHQHIVGNE